MTDLKAAPEKILRFVRRNCNCSKTNPCSTKVCSCKKHGLVCVSACGDCHVVYCENVNLKDAEIVDENGNIFDILEMG